MKYYNLFEKIGMTMMISAFVIHVVMSYAFDINIVTSVVITLPLILVGMLLYFGVFKALEHRLVDE